MGQDFVSLESELAAFTFLSSHYVLLGCINFPTVAGTALPHKVSLVVVDFVKSSSERTDIHDIEYQCALLFSEMQVEVAPVRMYIRAGQAHPTMRKDLRSLRFPSAPRIRTAY